MSNEATAHWVEGHDPQWVQLWVKGFIGCSMFLPHGVCFLFQRGLGDYRVYPDALSIPPSFQLTVEMFDYMDCELKLSESGEQVTHARL